MIIGLALFFQVVFAQVVAPFMVPPTTFAASAAECKKGNFLSFPTWYKYIKEFDENCSPKFSFLEGGKFNGVVITQILLALIDILLRLVSLVAVGYIVYGGFIYILSKGEPDQVKRGASTILHALAGLVIAIMATAVVAFIGGRLG